jgi:hyperosmotically inducible protein
MPTHAKLLLAPLFVALSLTACDSFTGGGGGASGEKYNPSNTAVNDRDLEKRAVTPEDQGQNEADIQVTADIRKAILADDSMSVNARNSKVVTANGVTTLRGVVNSGAEKASIEAKAIAIVGRGTVVNELEVSPPNN